MNTVEPARLPKVARDLRATLRCPVLTKKMNYLAHLVLAGDQPESIVGAILADFVRGRQGEQYSAGIRAGIRLHVRIDSFTDAHPVVALSKSRMRPPYRRFAGVLTDVFYDHFLARNWETYSPAIPLEEFARQSYAILWDAREILPERLRRMLPRMIEQDWLTSYRHVESIDRVLQGLARRGKRETPLPHAISVLREYDAELESDFTEFFPQLVEFAANQPRPQTNGSG